MSIKVYDLAEIIQKLVSLVTVVICRLSRSLIFLDIFVQLFYLVDDVIYLINFLFNLCIKTLLVIVKVILEDLCPLSKLSGYRYNLILIYDISGVRSK